MKLILLYDILQTIIVPVSTGPVSVHPNPTSQPFKACPVQKEENHVVENHINDVVENHIIEELRKRLSTVEEHLVQEREKALHYEDSLKAATMSAQQTEALSKKLSDLKAEYLTVLEAKEKENVVMQLSLKQLEESLWQEKGRKRTLSDDVVHTVECIQGKEIAAQIDNGMLHEEKENLIETIEKLTTRVFILQQELAAKQARYEKECAELISAKKSAALEENREKLLRMTIEERKFEEHKICAGQIHD